MTQDQQARYADDTHRYRLVSRIATGGMGEVWRATDTRLGRDVAVKLLKSEYADDATFRSRFSSEAQHAAALHHPGVAAVFDFGEAAPPPGATAPRPYLVMEHVDGQPLSALITPGRPLDPQVTRDLMAQAAEALGAAHAARIVHRDVKPANLIITPDRRVKVTDFGIARATEGMALTQTGQVMGTPQYLSPEQASGGTATPASDVYALGVVAFECLTSRRPFTGESPVATALAHLREPVPPLPDDVPADLATVVTRALAKDPGDRFDDGTAFAAALRDPSGVPHAAAATGPATRVLPAPAPVPPPAPPPRRGTRWRDLPWLWVLLVVVLLVGIIVLAAVAGDRDTGREPQAGTTSPSAAEPTTPTQPEPSPSEQQEETIELQEGDYLGRPFPEVEKELKDLGLEVERRDVDNDGEHDPETVAGVSPTSGLSEGDRVEVEVWKKPEGGPPDHGGPPADKGKDKAKGKDEGGGE